MAKGLPYFKFTPSKWLIGNICFEDLEAQGLFINICALYWEKDGRLTVSDINLRFKKPDAFNSLLNKYFSVSDGIITISFLDEQLKERNHISYTNKENGKRGGRPKTGNKKPVGFENESETKSKKTNIEEEKKRKEKKKNKNIQEEEDKNWRTDFKTYQKELECALNQNLNDLDYMKEREGYHGSLDIKKSITKAVFDYWMTEEGWKRCKGRKSEKINWRATFNNALTLKSNQVWLSREEKEQPKAIYKTLQPIKNHRDQ